VLRAGSRLLVGEEDNLVAVEGIPVVVEDILAAADSRQEDNPVAGDSLVAADTLAVAGIQQADSPAAVADNLAVGEDNRVAVADSPAVGVDIPVVEEDNRAVAEDSNRPVAVARRRMSYHTWRRRCCPG